MKKETCGLSGSADYLVIFLTKWLYFTACGLYDAASYKLR